MQKKIYKFVDIPAEIATGEARITIIGSNRVWVENHEGLERYNNSKMIFKSGDIKIKVEGEKLELERSESACAHITG